jgi:predicted dehydrogenase
MRAGLVGCGKISQAYLGGQYPAVRFVACADLDAGRAAATAEAHGLAALKVDELIADPSIELVCNLTVPQAHVEVSMAALRAGKHVYQEKPLALDRGGASALLAVASAAGRLVGCAPDTFLGAGLQTCRRLVDQGAIGEPVAALAHFANHGHEHWHPDPAFYYQAGGGPLFDMGPYYLTALVCLLGPICRVSGMARGEGSQRHLRSGPRAGGVLAVDVATHVSGVLEFAGGTIASLVTSFDVWASDVPRLELHGTEGSLSCPDPNTFGGPVRLCRAGGRDWEEVPIDAFELHQRGVGLADLAEAAAAGAEPRASGRLAGHVLDAMVGLIESSRSGQHVVLESDVHRPAPMPARA